MGVVRIWRGLWDLLFSKPRSLREAVLQTLLVYVSLVTVSLVVNAAGAAVRLALGHLPADTGVSAIVLNIMLTALPFLPLSWIRASRGLNFAVSFLGLAVFWGIAFWDRRFMTTALPDRGMVIVALIFVFLWAGNRFFYWRESRNAP